MTLKHGLRSQTSFFPRQTKPETIWKDKGLTCHVHTASNKANTWIQKLDSDLRNKVSFDIHPSAPQVDIQPTGSYEFWIRYADLVKYKPTNEQPSLHTTSPPLILPEI